jgi:gamma-glutamyl-gamma-aminobutyrate hydrolase PuuD
MNLQGWRYHVVGGDHAISKMMNNLGAIEDGFAKANIVIFSGGVDITPTLYDHGHHPSTQHSDIIRDKAERAAYDIAKLRKKHCVGICRGAQLLHVLNGGRLFQNVDGHHGQHKVVYINEKKEKYIVRVTSDHHQQMIRHSGCKVWGYAGLSTIKSTFTDNMEMAPGHLDDMEIIAYPETRTLCYQPHPEWSLKSDTNLFVDCVKRLMLESQ